MLILAPTEIKQKQLHLEASRWKSQDGWVSSPSSSHPHTLQASFFPGTRVEVLGVPWCAKCLDFFHPPVVDSLWLVIMLLHGWKSTCMIYIQYILYIRWKGEMLFHEAHTYSALYLVRELGKGAVFLYTDYNYVILYFPSYFLFLSFWPVLDWWLSPPVFPASFLIHFTFAGSPFASLFLCSCCCAAKNVAGSPAFRDTGKKRRLDFCVIFNSIIERFQ